MIKLKKLLTQGNNQKRVQLILFYKPRQYQLIVTPTSSELIARGFKMSFTNVFKETEYTQKHKLAFMRLDSYVAERLKQIAKSVGYDSAKFAQVLKTGGPNGSPKYPWLNMVANITLPSE